MKRLILLLAFAAQCFATAYSYSGSTGGNWCTSTNWTPNGTPGSGDTVTITALTVHVNCNVTIGTSPAAGTGVLTVTNSGATAGTLIIDSSVTLTVLGDFFLTHSTLTLSADSILEFDPSAASAPTTTSYRLIYGTGFGAPYATIQSSGTSAAHPYIIRTATAAVGSGYKRARVAVGSGAHDVISLAYGQHTNLGDTVNAAWNWQSNAETATSISFDHITWNTCGLVAGADAIPAASNFSYTNNVHTNTNAITNGGTGKVNPLKVSVTTHTTGTHLVQGNTFDKPPLLVGLGVTYKDNYFDQGWDDALSATAWAEFSGGVVRLINNSGQNASGSITNTYLLVDTWATSSSVATGTATAGTSTTLTDSSKSWTVNQFQSNASTANWFVQITGGTGAGQMRNITSNTSTRLTVTVAWTTTPDTSSTYTIYTGVFNPHMINPSANFATTFDGVITEFSGTDANGDIILSSAPGFNVTVTKNISLPNWGMDNPGTGINFGSSTDNVLRITAEHNTWYGGGQSPAVDDFTTHTGLVASFKSNLIWTGNNGTSGIGLGPFKLMDESHSASGATVTDIVSPSNADYNACWNCLAGNYQGNGYALLLSSQAGAHDVNMSGGTGPQFYDSSRNIVSWARSLGSTGSMPQTVLSDARTKLLNGTYSVSNLITYIKAGFAPSNSALHNTAHDGTDIGAVAWQAASFTAALSNPILW